MSLGMSWLGVDAALAALAKKAAEVDVVSRQVVTKSAAVVIRAAQANFEGAHKKGEPHVGGSLPNVVTGTLRRSIVMSKVTRNGVGDFSSSVGPTAVYGRAVELGLRNGASYPYFSPAVTATRSQVQAVAVATWRAWLLK